MNLSQTINNQQQNYGSAIYHLDFSSLDLLQVLAKPVSFASSHSSTNNKPESFDKASNAAVASFGERIIVLFAFVLIALIRRMLY